MPLSVLHINIDSLNRHFLRPYGDTETFMPNLTAFAERATQFDTHYVGSMACMPARRELWTGRLEFLHRPWGPIEPFDRPIARYFPRPGSHRMDAPLPDNRVSAFISDHYHFFEWGSHSYVQDFHGYSFIRGHEIDPHRTAPLPSEEALPDWAKPLYRQGPFFQRYVRNALELEQEADFFGPRVMQTTVDWLDRNHAHEGFYLMVDCFDVHEPFHVPEPYRSLYTDLPHDQHTTWTFYGKRGRGPLTDFDDDDEAYVRAQYRAKVTMVDRWLARVFDALDRHRLWERTVVIIGSDHGHYLGEKGWFGKPSCMCYDVLARIPLWIHHPDAPGNHRISSLTRTLDLYPTVLDALGCEPAYACPGRSLLPLLHDPNQAHCDATIYGYFGRQINITDGTWTYHLPPQPTNQPLYYYSAHPMNPVEWFDPVEGNPKSVGGRFLEGIDIPVWRTPCAVSCEDEPEMLFHVASDPTQSHNLVAERPDVVQRMRERLRQEMNVHGAPPEQYERFGLTAP